MSSTQTGIEARLIARRMGSASGPRVLVTAGVHGNEPAGIVAFESVIRRIDEEGLELRGELIGMRGNLRALATGRRFLRRDLNRIWRTEEIEISAASPEAEEAERHELLHELALLSGEPAAQPLILLDLHTTSADGPPFGIIGDTLRNRKIALQLPIPVVLGLEEALPGTLLEFVSSHGHVAVGVEGGQHDAESTRRNHEALILCILVAAGMLRRDQLPDFEERRDELSRSAGSLPRLLEVRYRHGVRPEDRFVMRPGYENFHAIEKGEQLAEDRSGPVLAPRTGRILLPLYQKEGEDGFFVARPVRRIWLEISAILRRLHVPKLLRFVPGVRVDPRNENVLIASRRVARFFLVEIFHLMGFRRVEQRGHEVAFIRRHPDDLAPLPVRDPGELRG